MSAVNETMRRFGHPDTVIAETATWSVQLRPQQAVLGALVVICREPVRALSGVSATAHADLKPLIDRTERCLKQAFAYDKINWLLLMMVDPDVHFHVLPRYAADRQFGGLTFTDPGWPAAPNLGHANALGPGTAAGLVAHLRGLWRDLA
jgi:diadenosine tetraphosphate (Ap4A) HIT family hydrolase